MLDNLVGQVDRHIGNYMVEELEDGTLGRVQGIDNDFAFGNTSLMGKNEKGIIGSSGKAILGTDGKMALPHMDKALADRILALREQDVRLMLVDVLEPQAIDAFWGRVEMAQKAIRTDMEENPESGRFLTDDSQWDETVKQDFLRDTVKGNSGSYSPRNYIAQFSSNMKSDSGATTPISGQLRGERYDVKAREIAGDIWSKMKGMSPDEAEQYLLSYKASPKIVSYLKNTGQLNGDSDVINSKYMADLRAQLEYQERERRKAKS